MVGFRIQPFLELEKRVRLSSVEICSEDTIHQVKQKIERATEIDVEKQDLYLGAMLLEDDNRTAADFGIQADEKIRIVRKVKGSIQVSIVASESNGRSTDIIINLSDTVFELKKRYFEETKVPIDRQKLTFVKKELENDKKLSEYEIKHEAKIHLITQLIGG